FIPTSKGVTIFKDLSPISEIDFHIFHEIYSGNNMTLFYQFPVIYPLKKSKENPKPVSFLGDKEITFAYGENWKLTKKIKIERKNPEKWDSTYRLGDINNDGFPDILFTETQGTINLKTILYIYISEGAYKYPANPQFEYKIKGAVSLPIIKDINNDGKDDLILFNIPLGLTNFINFFLRGKMSVETKVFLANTNYLSSKPDYQTTMTMDAPDGKDQIAYAIDDFSGDGILDIAYGQSQNTIQINIGLQEGNLKTKQWTKVSVPAFGIIRTSYINDNKSKDIIIYRPTGKNKERVDIILF
ncbi:MAG: FG-GAP repeat domain-containing protein, partial [Candidatus Hydrogenedens sp.]